MADFVAEDTTEALIGTRDRSALEEIVVFTNGSKYKKFSTSVGHLSLKFELNFNGAERNGVCTATIIDPNYILTAYHCLQDKDVEGNKVEEAVLYMGYLSSKEAAQPFHVEEVPVEYNERLDFAILKVEGNPAGSYGLLGLSTQTLEQNEELFVVHHPRGWKKTLSRRFCRVRGFATGETVSHDCHTHKGSSGAPIFPDNSSVPRVVGIHTGWDRFQGQTLNEGTLISSISTASCIVSDILAGNEPKPCSEHEDIDPEDPDPEDPDPGDPPADPGGADQPDAGDEQ